MNLGNSILVSLAGTSSASLGLGDKVMIKPVLDINAQRYNMFSLPA